jgi:hypothetical protein
MIATSRAPDRQRHLRRTCEDPGCARSAARDEGPHPHGLMTWLAPSWHQPPTLSWWHQDLDGVLTQTSWVQAAGGAQL